MSPTPPPSSEENASALYGIRTPKPGSHAYLLGTLLGHTAADIETVLQDFGLPTVATGTPVVALTDAARDAHWGTPATAAARRALQDSGALTVRPDKGWTEGYFAGMTDGGANAAGALVAGWYPVLGQLPLGTLKRSNAAWSVANNTVTLATDLITDIAAGVTVGTGAGTLTIVTPGLYEISAALCYPNPAASTGVIQLYLNKNSATFSTNPIGFATLANNTATQATPAIKRIIPLAAGDVLRMFAFQTSGAALAMPDGTTSQGASTTFAARYLGPNRA